MLRRHLAAAAAAVIALATCACTPPRAKPSSPPLPPPPPPPPQATGPCPTCCESSVHHIEIDPASTLEFRPSSCTLNLGGRYALEVALPDRSEATFDLFCQNGDAAIRIQYRGDPVATGPLTDLVDPFRPQQGRERVNTVSYTGGAPANGRYRFEAGELRFDRPPRTVLRLYDTDLENRDDGRGGYVELAMNLRFEGNRSFRASLRLCPLYEHMGPVSDPIP